MKKQISFKKWLVFGVLLELLILVYSYFDFDTVNEVFRHAARYSGRLSWLLYLGIFLFFSLTYHIKSKDVSENNRILITVFCVMHLIHFIFLSINVYANKIQLLPVKLAGGFLGYLLIVGYPIFYNLIKKKIVHLVYFYYLGIVIAGTYMARFKGEFEGAVPSSIHYIGFVSIPVIFLLCSILIFRKKSIDKKTCSL